jgi:hypothetical protein
VLTRKINKEDHTSNGGTNVRRDPKNRDTFNSVCSFYLTLVFCLSKKQNQTISLSGIFVGFFSSLKVFE